MNLNQLGNTDLWLTRIGFGAWAIGGGNWVFSWGPQDDNESIRAIQKAIDLGMNWIDTAAVYGLGHSEEIVGKAVKSSSTKPFIFTKCGMVWNDKREVTNSLKSIRQECEASLRRLQMECIDLYQIHWPRPDDEIEEAWTVMDQLHREGKVRHIGVSNFSTEQIERCARIAPVASLQPPYSMIQNRAAETEILPYCLDRSIGVINYSPMHSGLLTGAMTRERVANLLSDDFRRNVKNFKEPFLSRNLEIAEFLKSIAARHRVSAGVIAIAWTLANPAVTAAIVGGRSPEQVEGVFPAADFQLSPEEKSQIDDFLASHPAPQG